MCVSEPNRFHLCNDGKSFNGRRPLARVTVNLNAIVRVEEERIQSGRAN
jgi:hypothetical protein